MVNGIALVNHLLLLESWLRLDHFYFPLVNQWS